ncbi:DUF3566 domain-containing protein [Corynebacterium variabile]|uniref:DUF3566 domain-containing protein n=1 Tax=Corynebacterium variabile TaxID=1727 RepID=UPI003735A31F
MSDATVSDESVHAETVHDGSSAVGEGPALVRTTLAAVDPRSAARLGVAVGVCLFVAWMVAAMLVYIILGATGVWDRVNSLAGDLLGADGVSAGVYFGVAALVGVLEVIVATLFIPLGAMLYNAVAGYVGGLRVTLGAGAVVEAVEASEDTAEGAEGAESAVAEAEQDAESDAGTDADADAVTTEVAAEPPSAGGAAAAGWGSGVHRAK